MTIKGPKGTHDILYAEARKWQRVESAMIRLATLYGYNEIRTPIFESTDLFLRGVGDTTDIVDKEMYTFLDKGDRSITLRPEGTASVARSFIEHSGYNDPLPARFFYLGPMFRYSRPQTGRYRQFHQFGIEAIGSNDPRLDGEVLNLIMDLFKDLGIVNLTLELNSVGCPVCRPIHKELLKKHLQKNYEDLCPTCQVRFEKNPLRIFDCKNPKCQEIADLGPTITDHLCGDCHTHFEAVQDHLKQSAVPYTLNKKMVRGLDYYTKTAFEISAGRDGAQSSIGGGGRYDGLIKELGGPGLPGIGFAIGMERVLLTMEDQGLFQEDDEAGIYVYVANVTLNEREEGSRILNALRKEGFRSIGDNMDRSFKAQFKYANKIGATHVISIGENESAQRRYPMKNMKDGSENILSIDEIIKTLKGELV